MSIVDTLKGGGQKLIFKSDIDSTAASKAIIFSEFALFLSKKGEVYCYAVDDGEALKQVFSDNSESIGRLWGHVKKITSDRFEKISTIDFDSIWQNAVASSSPQEINSPEIVLDSSIIDAALSASLRRQVLARI